MSEETTPSQDALKIVVVDESKDALDRARDRADARLDTELGEGGRFKRFVSGIWKGNVAKEYYRQKYTRQELDGIQDAHNVLIESPADARTRALEATIERFQMQADELIHTDAGEKREVQASDSDIATGLQGLIRQYCEGTLNDVTLQEERTRFLQEYRALHGEEAIGKGIATTDNILEVARAVRGAVDHGESVDAAISRIEVITGEARNGARTEARYNAVDKVIDKISKTKFGSLIGPEVVATSVTLAASIARWGSHSVLGAVTKTVLPGVAAGVWAGLRENKRFKDERAQHMRESAQGAEFDDSAKRRSELESTRYETQTAESLTEHLQTVSSEEFFEQGGEAALRAALEAIAAIETRVKLSDTKNIDLITYRSAESIGDERMQLDLARATAKVELSHRLTDGHRALLGFEEGTPLQDIIDAQSETFISSIEQDVTAKDKAFQKLKRARVARAAAIGVATGLAGGLLVQEGIAAIDPTREGLLEQIWGGNDIQIPVDQLDTVDQHQTLLQGIVQGEHTTIHTGPSGEYAAESLAENSELSVSTDHEIVDNKDGTFSLVDPNGKVTAENIAINEDGSLPAESIEQLESVGMVVEDQSFDKEVVTTVQEQVSADQYIQNHIAETTSVTRELWYGNDTPGIYDQNELRVYRGGSADAPGIVEGGYQYTVAGMHPDGSWQGGESVDWNQAAASGNLFVAVSGTFDTQGNPFMIPIGPDGSVNIPADSPAGQFFANENGAVAFNGAYMEIVQTTGVNVEGEVSIRPLATLVGGEDAGLITDTITTTTIEHHSNYEITTAGYDTVQDNFTEAAPVTPVESRRNLETPRRRVLDSYNYYNGAMGERERQQALSEMSPRLRENPDTVLNPKEELDWFREQLAADKGSAYLAEVEAFVQNDPALKSMSSETASMVTIPVAAASESATIYSTLSLYAQQEGSSTQPSVILLNVNWLDTAIDDPEKVANIQRTIAEIERARQSFPNLAISVMQKEYIQSEVEATGGIIGYVAEDLMNVALMSVRQKIANGEMSDDHDVLIVRSDADVRGMARTQLRNFERAASENRDLDIVKGVTRFGVEEQQKFPGFGIATAFTNAVTIASTQENAMHTGGANFAVRASTLAAIGGLGKMYRQNQDGELYRYTGAGSDDTNVGRRIRVARQLGRPRSSEGYYGSIRSDSDGSSNEVRRIKMVAGAAIDTNPARVLPYYVKGQSFQAAWDERQGGFADGPGNYRDRNEDTSLVENASKERADQPSLYAAIEANISTELSWSSEDVARRTLALFFGSVPGAYRIRGTIGESNVRFTFTKAGREFIKNRIERETNGRYGSYGARKKRQLYGITPPGAKRQPAGDRAPLVSPLS